MPGKWIKVPPKKVPVVTTCDTEGCEVPSHGHEFCTVCFKVKIHHLAFCDDCGVCQEDVIEDCKQCKLIEDNWTEPFKLCHAAECKHKWNALNYRKPVIGNKYRTKGCTCITEGVHEKGRPCKVHSRAKETT